MEPGTASRRDVAEFERRIRELTARLEEMERELESLSYAVSHDLRSPLRAIDGFSLMILEEHAAGLDPEGRRLLGLVRDNTQRMGRLIEDLLAYSRLNRVELRPAELDMTDLARSMYFEVTSPEQRERICFTLRPLPPCRGDTIMLRRVWTNLLSNAVKFSFRREQPAIEVGGSCDRESSSYFVRDNGVGFDMEYAGKLFKMFQRLHGPREFEGTGAGLATVQRIIRRHGGRVGAEAAPDAGATFTFTIPVEERPA